MDQLVALPTKPGAYMESQSGLARGNPLVYGRLRGGPERDLVFVVFHPTSNFFGHYLLAPIAERGASILALNTRYVGNDTMLIMERALQDIGAAIAFLRREGFRRIALIGNSGGGSLAALYQQQAAKLTIETTPDGRSFPISAEDLPLADGLALVAAHIGRAEQLLTKIDPSLIDEDDPGSIDPSLDMFDARRAPPYDEAWVRTYREAQQRRLRRIVDRVEARLALLNQARSPNTADEAFVVHRTQADPRNLDLALDANDRAQGTLGGAARDYNFAANGLARFSTLRSFLSQWSPWHTRAHGPRCLRDVAGPKLVLDYTADQTVFPSQVAEWRAAAGPGADYLAVKGATHYLAGQPELVATVADTLLEWAKSRL